MSPQQFIAHYRITSKLGQGGMGEVWRATDTKLNREVAIKILPDIFAQDAGRMARFQREAQVLASLNHPNIGAIYGTEDRALILELVEGPTLAARIQQGAMQMEEALPIARQIAEALEYAHEKGIVHRDLKPANIKLTPDGTVKVLDFGLARMGGAEVATESSPTVSLSETRAGAIMGTAGYMSPEQARGGIVDKRADIWAFGVVMYEMLTGRLPFTGQSLSETLASVWKDEPRWDELPVRVRRLVKKCLEKDPKRRLSDIADVWALMDDESPLWSRFAIAGWAAAGVLAIALAVALSALWRIPPAPDRPLTRLLVDLGSDGAFSDTVNPLTVSPDGRRLALAQGGKLWVREMDEAQSVPLAGTEGAIDPFFSPDGLWVGFESGGKLWKVSVRGGAPAMLCDAPHTRGASWGPDGYIIAALDRVGGLWRVPENGGKPEPATHTDPNVEKASHRFPQVLPGGAGVLFTAGNGTDPAGNLIVAQSLKSGQQKILWKGGTRGRYLPDGHLVFVYRNTLYAAPMSLDRLELTGQPQPMIEDVAVSPLGDSAWYDVTQSGTLVFVPSHAADLKRSIVRLEPGTLGAGQVAPLLPGQGLYSGVRLSPDGRRLLFAWEQNRITDIWVNDMSRDAPTKLTFGAVVKSEPRWTSDGRYSLYFTRGGQGDGIAAVRTDGAGGATQLLEGRPAMSGYSLSPDGKTIAFAERDPRNNTGLDLWVFPIDVTGAAPIKTGEPRVFLRTPKDEGSPEISPDGRWVAYVSNESGQNEVYVRSFPAGGGQRLASTGGGDQPKWSPNRRDLFYRNRNGQIMTAVYTVSGDSFSLDKPRLWSSLVVADFDIARDGKSVAAIVNPSADADKAGSVEAVFVFNFFDELRRRVPSGKVAR